MQYNGLGKIIIIYSQYDGTDTCSLYSIIHVAYMKEQAQFMIRLYVYTKAISLSYKANVHACSCRYNLQETHNNMYVGVLRTFICHL